MSRPSPRRGPVPPVAAGRGPVPPAAAALVSLVLAMVSVQFGASRAEALFPIVGPAGAAALRVTLSALMVVLALRPWRRPLPRSRWPALAAYGASLGLMNLFFYMALARTPLGLAVALEFTGPLTVSVVFSRRRRDLLWVVLAAVGLLALLPHADLGAHGLDPAGAVLALLAGVFWALYIVFGKRAGAEGGSEVVAVGACVAAVVAAPIGLAQAGPALFSPAILPGALIVAFFSSALPYSLEMIALRRLPPGVFGSLMSLEPAVAVGMGWLTLHQPLPPLQLTAVLAVVTASVGAATGARSALAADPP